MIDVDRLAVEDSSFRDTAGVAPQAGVDLEPSVTKVPSALNANSGPLEVRLERSISQQNLYGFAVIMRSSCGKPVAPVAMI